MQAFPPEAVEYQDRCRRWRCRLRWLNHRRRSFQASGVRLDHGSYKTLTETGFSEAGKAFDCDVKARGATLNLLQKKFLAIAGPCKREYPSVGERVTLPGRRLRAG